jgi:hypothetical protein
MGARNRVGIRLSYRAARLHSLAELVPFNRLLGSLKVKKIGLCIVQTSETVFLTCKEPRNRFQGNNSASPCSLAVRYDNPIPTRFLALIDFF